MKRIILDTNFLIYCSEYKIDFFTEIDRIYSLPYKLAVLSRTIEELEKVKPKKLSLIKKFIEKIEVIPSTEKHVDKDLIELSEKGDIIATQDQELKRKLKGHVIVIRQKKYLEFRK